MKKPFEELDYRQTSMGELILRRRKVPMLGDKIVHEVILNGEFLMSSLFHAGEDALAELGLAAAPPGPLDVVVGGLGLGYTAAKTLENNRLRSLLAVESLPPVLSWHRSGLVPLGSTLANDPRSRFIEGDFFDLASGTGFDPADPARRFHAILLDIDHTPEHWLHPKHRWFYTIQGLEKLRQHLHPGGVFALWSDAAPDDAFCARLRNVFEEATAHSVPFPNPLLGSQSRNTVYVANCSRTGAEPGPTA